jgi:lipoprotein-releasing system permease protein
MLAPLEVFIGLRYVRSREAGQFVSFITWTSLAGVALGVLALIVILSVMNGFEGELRSRLVSLSAHATLSVPAGELAGWQGLAERAKAAPGVVGVAPYLEAEALATHGGAMNGVMLRGIDPGAEPTVSTIGEVMVSGALADLKPGSEGIVLGRVLAFQLGVGLGDPISLLVPERASAEGGIEPRIRSFTVVGVFEVGLQEHDQVLALVHFKDAEALLGHGVTGLRLRYADLYAAPRLARALAAALPGSLAVRDWTEENATYFRAIRIEKTMMTLLLLLVVGVAAFNIVAMLVMVVRAKRTDIAILRTLGLAPRGVVGVFLAQGLVIGWTGTFLGVALGVPLAANAGPVLAFLERVLHFQMFAADVYYVTRLPSRVDPVDVTVIAVAGLLITLAATLYPAIRAARTAPAEVLRYE